MTRSKKPEIEEGEPEPFLIGYARVSTFDQSLDAQIDALKRYGVLEENIYRDQLSAVSNRRRGWEKCKLALRRGDTLVVYALSRLGRDIRHLLDINKMLLEEGVTLKSLTEPIDTRTADGKLLFTVRAAFAQFERDITIERTKMGLAQRKEAGFALGRPPVITEKQKAAIHKDLCHTMLTRAAIARKHGFSDSTVKKYFPKPRHAYILEGAKGKRR